MGKVSIAGIGNNIKQSLNEALGLIGGLAAVVRPGDSVLVKPNLNGVEGSTSKELVAALLELLHDYAAGRVFMAESTFGSEQMTDMFFNKTGFSELARQHNIPLVNLNRSEAVTVKVTHPQVLETLQIAREACEADVIINMPNMKVHYATGITLALKNMKGVLVRDEKKHFHEAGLDKAIVDLNNTIKPALNIVDAIECMERMGPRGGDPVSLGLIMAGREAAEVDYAGCQVMGYTVSEVKHLEYFLDINRIDTDGIKITGERIEDVHYPFKKVNPEQVLPREITVHNRNACSACTNALLLSCQLLEKQPSGVVDIYLGSLPDESVPATGTRLGFGNCCPANPHFTKIIKGCPPYPFTLREYLKSLELI